MTNLSEFLQLVPNEVLCGNPDEIMLRNAYVCDLLSDVMGNAREGDIWITIMRHINIIAVASLAGIPAIIFPKNIKPEIQVVNKAKSEKIALITTTLTTFEISGKLYQFLKNHEMV